MTIKSMLSLLIAGLFTVPAQAAVLSFHNFNISGSSIYTEYTGFGTGVLDDVGTLSLDYHTTTPGFGIAHTLAVISGAWDGDKLVATSGSLSYESCTSVGNCIGDWNYLTMLNVTDPIIISGGINFQFQFDAVSVYTSNFTEVSEVPLPAAWWLFGSALIGLAGIQRKK
ncbi:VPLPA-CTERM sorting domain-containing protein [Oceanicoccus sp. KOV_DT_Chl]|uniref:VPLPA-CTERM sorting domain-containing protein n=1 Tax=Oceanicoccus sp. KOV_DT_Chl TaxID=1904639 RepID=UPI000C7BF7AB|nr:VPLPA-CTERM sorting domain-containing protein [Oceanicoccus sp. KOV_DT_Chl]